MQLRIIKAENACIPSLRARVEELLSSKTALETEMGPLKANSADLDRLRGIEACLASANGQISTLDARIKELQTSLMLEQGKVVRSITLQESAESKAEELGTRVESVTTAHQQRFVYTSLDRKSVV